MITGSGWNKAGNGEYGYYRLGCYASQLKPYLELFPRKNFYFLLLEDLYQNFNTNMVKLLQFLEVDDTFSLTSVQSNKSAVPRDQTVYNLVSKFKKSKTSIKKLIKPFLPTGFGKWFIKDALMKPFEYPPMEDAIRKELY